MLNEWYWVRDGTLWKLFHKVNIILNKSKEKCVPNYVAKSYAEMLTYIASH